jgi:hypothetical protein
MEGLRIWGSPVTPLDWGAFGPETAEERERLFSRIPQETDVLITHGPPRGILDAASRQKKPRGCDQLLAAVRRVRPRLHVFGHIHEQYGMFRSSSTLFVNVALAGPDYSVIRRPIQIDLRCSALNSGPQVRFDYNQLRAQKRCLEPLLAYHLLETFAARRRVSSPPPASDLSLRIETSHFPELLPIF